MKKNMIARRLSAALLILGLILPMTVGNAAAESGSSAASGSAASSASGSTSSAASGSTSSSQGGKIVILHTNDVHCAVDQVKDSSGKITSLGYAAVASYKKKMQEEYGAGCVSLIDAGDSIQGGNIGTLSTGSWLINIMNHVGYDLSVPGNHEFDFGVDRFLELTKTASFPFLSCNFMTVSDSRLLLSPYKIMTYGNTKVAYVGICTPESYTKSTPAFFKDDSGNLLYGFDADSDGTALYKAVQNAVDSARNEGADYVVAVGHLGETGVTDIWRASSVVAHTTGIDILIDGHSHEQFEDQLTAKDGKSVVRAQTGTKLAAIGKIVIDTETGKISQELISSDTDQDQDTLTYISGIESQFQGEMDQEVGQTSSDLTVMDPDTGNRAIRNAETNLGDLCADAYRNVLGADIGLSNGGGIRADIKSGSITMGDILNVYPWGTDTCVINATGQQILDALEFSASKYPDENGGFLQISNLTYTLDASVASPVKTNDNQEFVSADGERRVRNVRVGGSALDPSASYTIAGSIYTLQEGGDGFTMFSSGTPVSEGTMKDYEALQKYIQTNLNGKVGTDYSNPKGQGRITIAGASSGSGSNASGGSYTVVRGDSLWKIAEKTYGSGSFWKKIYKANTDRISDPDLIYPDQELVLPAA